jgi:gas vesicle protein
MTNAMANRRPMGIAFIAGIISGVAAGLFLRSEKGQEITEQASKDAIHLQKQLLKKLKTVQSITRERYEEVVDELIARYARAKDLARSELIDLKEYLMDQWDDIRSEWTEREEEASKV